MTSRFIEPFDFKTLYIQYFLGNQALFSFVFILITSFLCAYLRIPNNIFLVILALGSIMFGAYMGESIYVLVLFIVGFFTYRMLVRLFG